MSIRPFLKYPGGKFKIYPSIINHLPRGKRLVEPFCGSCAIALNTDYPSYLLGDLNADIIQLCRQIKHGRIGFIKSCSNYFVPKNKKEDTYYELRERFNAVARDRLEGKSTRSSSQLFLYLNRHCYNGLSRYNKGGMFNVPFGHYERPYFPLREMLAFMDKAEDFTFFSGDFRACLDKVETGDVVYCDPPYSDPEDGISFKGYTSNGFSSENHRELVDRAKHLSAKGVPVVISNHDTLETRELYKDAKSIHTLETKRQIGCTAESRKKIRKEIVVIY